MDALLKGNLITTKDAAKLSGYTSDYLSRLARSGKIIGRKIGHSWFVDKESLKDFSVQQGDYKVNYARALTRTREAEYRAHHSFIRQVIKAPISPIKKFPTQVVQGFDTAKIPPRSNIFALSVATLVLMFATLIAQSAVIPQIAEGTAFFVHGVSSGLRAALADASTNFASQTIAAKNGLRARFANAAMLNPFSFAPATPASYFSENTPTRSLATLTAMPIASAATPIFTTEDAHSFVLDTYSFFTKPSFAVNALVSTLSAFGASIINVTHFAIQADVALAYGLAEAAPESARATVSFIGNIGDMFANATVRVPTLAAALYFDATSVPAAVAPNVASAVFNVEYRVAVHFVVFTYTVTTQYLAFVSDTGRLAYEDTAGTFGIMHSALSSLTGVPAALEDAYLGTLGKSALVFDSVGADLASTSHAPMLAAALPALSAGEHVALLTYQTINSLFDSATGALVTLFGTTPDVAVVSNPPQTVLPFGTSTTSVAVPQPLAPPIAPPPAPPAPAPVPPPASLPHIAVTTYPTYTTIMSGVSEDFVNQSLATLRASILSTVAGMVQPVAAQTATNVTSIQQVNMIQDLSNLIVRNGDFRGGTFDSGSVTNGISVSANTGNFANLTAGSLSVTGIGTTTLAGSIDASGGLFVNGVRVTGTGGSGNVNSGVAGQFPYYAANGITLTATSSLFASTAGNIGIGTTSPGSLLSIQGVANFTTATSTFYGTGGVNLGAGCFAVNGVCVGNGSGAVSSGTTGQFSYYATNSTTLTATSTLFLASSGDIGINTISPAASLSVAGANATQSIDLFDVSQYSGGPAIFAIGTSTGEGGVTVFQNSTASAEAFNYVLSPSQPFGLSMDIPSASEAYMAKHAYWTGTTWVSVRPYNSTWGDHSGVWQVTGDNPGNGVTFTPTARFQIDDGNGAGKFGGTQWSAGGTSGGSGAGLQIGDCGGGNPGTGSLCTQNNLIVSGKTGIGTTTPARHLDIANSDGLAQILLEDSTAAAGFHGIDLKSYHGDFSINSLTDAQISTNRFLIASTSGFVGIGDANPSTNLYVLKAGIPILPGSLAGGDVAVFQQNGTASDNAGVDILGGTSGQDQVGFDNSNSTWGILGYDNALTSFYFETNGSTTRKVTINGSGRVGIGTTTPYAPLEVWGPDNGATTTAFAVVNSASTTAFSVYDNGNATYQGSIFQSSDQRLKTNITQLDASFSIAAIDALNPVSFYWRPETERGTERQYGFIAQQVQSVFPNLVATSSPTTLTPDGTLTVNYDGLISPMIRAIQQLDTRTNFLANAASSTVLTVDVGGNVGIATTTPSAKLTISGNVFATSYEASPAIATSYAFGTTTTAAAIPSSVLTVGGNVDLYKLATFTLSGVQALADRVDAQDARVTSLETRVAALESGAISTASGSPVSFSTSSLASALDSFGILVQKGIAQFNTLVFQQLVASSDANGTSSAGSVTVLAGNTVAQVNNSLVQPSTKVFVTFNSQITGDWWVSDKAVGSFRVVFSAPQTSDVSFDYFLVQTEGQIATSTPSTAPSVTQSGGTNTTPPIITLLGDNPVHISVGGTFVEPGVTITDNVDGTDPYITFVNGIQQVVSSTTIDTSSPTTYLITYKATDAAGNTATAMRSVIVGNPDGTVSVSGTASTTSSTTTASSTPPSTDRTPPVVTLIGEAAMQITVGNAFTDPGATATDDVDGNLTAKIVVTGSVDTATAGLYTLTYSATDAAGNTSSVSRVVTVAAPPAAPSTTATSTASATDASTTPAS
ncbi:MAG: immunoglobulin-like domain-containing protein [Minisyncoccota bacterium]